MTPSTDIGLNRTRRRERERFGERLDEGGPRHRQHLEFMAWPAGYDDPAPTVGRNRRFPKAWLAHLISPMIRVKNAGTPVNMLGTLTPLIEAVLPPLRVGSIGRALPADPHFSGDFT